MEHLSWQKNQLNLKLDQQKLSKGDRKKILLRRNGQNPELWDNIRSTNIHVLRVQRKKENRAECLKKSWASFPKLMRIINPNTYYAKWIPSRINTKRFISRHSIVKWMKTKDKKEAIVTWGSHDLYQNPAQNHICDLYSLVGIWLGLLSKEFESKFSCAEEPSWALVHGVSSLTVQQSNNNWNTEV